MINKSIDENSQVAKIAVINPYLQGGHTNTAEMESIARFVKTANARNIDVGVFATSEEIKFYRPDFVIAITYQEGKLTEYPTYISVNIPISMIRNVPRFVRNILSCDAFLTACPSNEAWLLELCKKHQKKFAIAPGYFTVPKTDFKPADYKNAVAMYMGTNWDGLRHHELFKLLGSGEYLRCYGPKKSWENYPSTLYGGNIPFDGVSAIETYHKHGAGLCIGHPIFDQEAVANNRMFEIAAASALPICSTNELTKSIYGDTVLYFDKDLSTAELAEQVIENVKWIRSEPDKAKEMAYHAHAIFNEKLSMEYYLSEILKLHERISSEKGYSKNNTHHVAIVDKGDAETSVEHPRVCYVILSKGYDYKLFETLDTVLDQNYLNLEVIVLTNHNVDFLAEKLQQRINFGKHGIKILPYNESGDNTEIHTYLIDKQINWIGLIKTDEKLFVNHTSLLLQYAQKNPEMSVLYSGNLEYSNNFLLQEKLNDEHRMPDCNRIRIGHFNMDGDVPLGSILFNARYFIEQFKNICISSIDARRIIATAKNDNTLFFINEITCAVDIDQQILVNDRGTLIQSEANIQKLNEMIKERDHYIQKANERKETGLRLVEEADQIRTKLKRFLNKLA